MRPARIHITGPSGSGTTSLSRLLANRLDYPHHDSDDYYWKATATPYREVRDGTERLRLMNEIFVARPDWIVSGSLMVWADDLIRLLDLVIYLYAPVELRAERLRDREGQHFGDDAIAPGGWRAQETDEFLEWASHYEDGTREGRKQSDHEAWLAALPCPVLRLDSTRRADELVEEIADWLLAHEAYRQPWADDRKARQ
ncbi:MAG: AAA family ATPase [Alphaproteobacteria bacterium]|nr:AAA family ATPase [Rhodospirillaceae bacterium]MBT7611752.1 AAA family ATPase [Rhodospirillaceae bacterium]MDG2482771.1 AAA family ATPase [Alphaproteobacteria bacterium]